MEAIASAGASWRSWDGGLVQPPLLTSAPLPSLADAMAASTSRSRLSTGGGDLASGFLRPAKLEPLGLLDPVGVDAAANFVALLAGRPHAARPLSAARSFVSHAYTFRLIGGRLSCDSQVAFV